MPIKFFKDSINGSVFPVKCGFIYTSGIRWIITGYITKNFFYGIEINF